MLIGTLAIALYLLTAAALAWRLRHNFERGPGLWAALALGLGAVILHLGDLSLTLPTAQGINLGFFNALSLISSIIVLVLLLSAFRQRVEVLCIPFLALAALSIGLAHAFPTAHILNIGGPWQLQAHILISLLAYSILSIAMGQALLLAYQDYRLRRHRPGGLLRALPALQDMESLLFQLIGLGFVLLTVSLLTGTLFIEDMFARHLAHKTILSIVAWLLFLVLLWGRYRRGWRGKVAIRWTLAAFLTLMLAYLGSKLVLELLLKRGVY